MIHTEILVNADGTLTVLRYDDLQDELDELQRLRECDTGRRPDGWLLASIPPILYEKIQNDTGANMLSPEGQDRLRRLLNDRDYSKLRIAGGRV
jgi:hypothetical protein